MFDSINALAASFSGKLDKHPQARKLGWLLLFAFLAGWACTAFVTWVSYSSYFSLIQNWMVGAAIVAGFIAFMMAGSIYFLFQYISGFAVEVWMKVPASVRNYSALGFRLSLVAAAIIGFMEFSMEIQGGKKLAQNSSAQVAAPDYDRIHNLHAGSIEADRKRLAELTSGQLGFQYGWKDPKSGIYHLNKRGAALQATLTESITESQRLESRQVQAEETEWKQMEGQRAESVADTSRVVNCAIYLVYVMIVMLCIVQAFCVETIQHALAESGKPGFTAPEEVMKAPRYSTTGMGFQTMSNVHPDTQNPSGTQLIQAAPIGFQFATTTAPPQRQTVRNTHTESVRTIAGHPAVCSYCGTDYVAAKKPVAGKNTFCNPDHKNQFHTERQREERRKGGVQI